MRQYRVWMRIAGSVVKPAYDGYVDVWAATGEDPFEKAVDEARRTAHWDSPRQSFRLERIETR